MKPSDIEMKLNTSRPRFQAILIKHNHTCPCSNPNSNAKPSVKYLNFRHGSGPKYTHILLYVIRKCLLSLFI